ncbi:bacteriocin-like protein [Chryseobacterium contaminans]|uniref:bacteriocin-like protein n=1 Tax=Chryseobacterium contaminans TaxID=1423959 RepID=UPI00301802D2
MKNLKKISRGQLQSIKGSGFINNCKGKEEGAFCDWVSASGYGTGTCDGTGNLYGCIPD